MSLGWLTIKAAAEKFFVSEYTVRVWAREGKIPRATKKGNRWYIPDDVGVADIAGNRSGDSFSDEDAAELFSTDYEVTSLSDGPTLLSAQQRHGLMVNVEQIATHLAKTAKDGYQASSREVVQGVKLLVKLAQELDKEAGDIWREALDDPDAQRQREALDVKPKAWEEALVQGDPLAAEQLSFFDFMDDASALNELTGAAATPPALLDEFNAVPDKDEWEQDGHTTDEDAGEQQEEDEGELDVPLDEFEQVDSDDESGDAAPLFEAEVADPREGWEQ